MNEKIDAFELKLVATIFMIVDHVHTYLNIGPAWISILPRFVAPLFVFFLVEGFFKTSSREKYFKRTFSFALLMQLGNVLINYLFKNVDFITGEMSFYSLMEGNNIFLTLALFLLIMMQMEKIKVKKNNFVAWILLIVLSSFSIFVEGGIYLYPVLIIMYVFYNKQSKMIASLALWTLALFASALMSYMSGATGIGLIDTLSFKAEWAMIFVIPFILLYSGNRGRNDSFAKWFFYVIYPSHLWILSILNRLYIH